MKILRIQSRICVGGPAVHTILLTAHLNPQKYQTTLVGGALQPDEKDISFLARSNNVEFKIIREMGREVSIFKDLIALIKLYFYIRQEKPDIVHTHTAKAGAIGRLAAFLARVPRIYHTFHGHTFYGYFHPIKTKIIIYIERLLAKMSTKIVAISPSQKYDICERFAVAPSQKTEIIPLGFDFERMKASSETIAAPFASLANNCIKIGSIGRLVPIKDHDLLLDAFAKALSRVGTKNATLFLIGDGEQKSHLEARVSALGISDNVVFAGTINNIQDVYPALDLVVLTSKNEGTPVSLIEAMYFGVPILAVRVGGVGDIVPERCGVLVNSREVNTLAEKLASLITNKAYRASFKNQGREHVLQQFSIQRLVRDIERLYQE